MTILERVSPANSTSSQNSASSAGNSSGNNNNNSSTVTSLGGNSSGNSIANPLSSLAHSTAVSMISSMADRYITPEYLAPLPPTDAEKSGKSPLQLLAQTCSQIGADTGSNKLLAEKSGSNDKSNGKSNHRSPALVVTDAKPVTFKPYESSKSTDGGSKPSSKPSSVVSLSPGSSNNNNHSSSSPKVNGKSPSPSATSKDVRSSSSSSSTTTPVTAASTESSTSTASATPVIRSGMEVLAGHSKDLSSFRLPHALDPTNPAFRPPFGAIPGYPPTSLAASLASSVCRDPFCRDATCPTAIYNAQIAASLAASGAAAAGALPPGYAELLQAHKLGLGLPTTTAAAAAASASTTAAASALAGPGGPYICNWMNGREGYCGKRHSSAEELLQHLRTHTNLSTSDSSSLLSASSMYPPGLLAGAAGASAAAAAAAGLHRSYAASSALGSLSSNRFHPYSKPGAGLPSALPPSLGLGALGVGPPLPPSLAGLGAAAAAGAYSPSSLYALYGSRLAGGSLP